MLKTATPTLEIKTTGMDLSKVETIFITIKRMDFQTVKSNDDIEVENDVVHVFLTAEEASRFDEGGANISITAYLDNGESVAIKIVWVKKGSRTAGGGGVGKITLIGDVTGVPGDGNTIDTTVNSVNGVRIQQDAEGNWGYIPPGADAVVPFRKGGGGMGFPLLGVVPSDVVGTLWMEDGGNEMSGSEQVFVLSSSLNTEGNGIWCEDGEPFALSFTVPGVPSDEIGAMWIE